MSAPSETYDIDCFGDILLVLISGDSQSNLAAQEENISASFSESDTLLDDASFLDSSLVDGVLTSDASQSPSTIVNHEPRRAVRFRVASHRLRRSSPVFEQLLYQYVGYPGAAYQSHYPIRIPIWNDDPPIMDLMLRIIHKDDPFETQDQDISQLFPSTECLLDHIDLETLARIATVADKYQLHSSLDFWLTKWVDEIWDNMEESSMSEALDWVWVAWAFDLTDHFSAATAYVAKSSAEPVEGNDDFEYSCPTDVLRAIDQIRLDALTELYCLFTAQLEPALQSAASLLDECHIPKAAEDRSIMTAQESCKIGLLLLQGHRLKFWPNHDPDFQGISYAEACEIISDMARPNYYQVVTPEGRVSVSVSPSCEEQFTDLLGCLEDRGWGLDLDYFKTRSRTVQFTY